jgi:hypothetical protein
VAGVLGDKEVGSALAVAAWRQVAEEKVAEGRLHSLHWWLAQVVLFTASCGFAYWPLCKHGIGNSRFCLLATLQVAEEQAALAALVA